MKRPLLVTGIAIVLVAINLRPSMATIGPLVDRIQASTGASNLLISLLTTLPVALIGIGAACGRLLRTKLGEERGITTALCLIGGATLLRYFLSDGVALLITAAVAGVGIAMTQALMTSFIKRRFGRESGRLTGLYTTSIMAGAAVSAMTAPFVAQRIGWEGAVAAWAIAAAAGLAAWTYATRTQTAPAGPDPRDILASERGKLLNLGAAWGTSSSDDTGDLLLELSFALPTGITRRQESREMHFLRNRRAWALMIYFGIATAAFTLLLAWLPPFYTNLGVSESTGGLLLGGLTLVEVCAGFIVSVTIHRFPDRRKPLWLATTLLFCGLLILILSPLQLAIPAIVLIGLGSGAAFPLSIILTMDHLSNPDEAGALTDFVQAGAYLIASLSPAVAGIIRDRTADLSIAWWAMAALVLLMFLMTFSFSTSSYHRIETKDHRLPKRRRKRR